WTRELQVMGAPTPSAGVGALLLAEMVLHGWDVARAIGEAYHCDGPVLAAAAGAVDDNAELFRQYQGFAPPVTLPARASAFDRLLATSGRDPAWTAP
ncbi:MAG TPA: TIGR03086 family protein, partial [Streptosporangiaceae bacterium]